MLKEKQRKEKIQWANKYMKRFSFWKNPSDVNNSKVIFLKLLDG